MAEHLRRLRLPQLLARLGRLDPTGGIGALERIGDRHREYAADLVRSQRVEHALQFVLAQAGPRRVVHQHPVVGFERGGGRDQAVQHAVVPCRAAAVKRRDALAELAPGDAA